MNDEQRDEEAEREWYDRKTALMEEVLGPEHGTVMHAIIPYALGGGLDLYYFPNGIPGTAIATKECCETPDDGSSNDVFEQLELVMFTKQELNLDDALDDTTSFGQTHSNINAILNCIAPYSAEATLNPHETCEFPSDMDTIGGKCMIFDAYGAQPTDQQPFGLLLLIEIFRSEMDFARENGGLKLINKLKTAGHYPYSDLDREPVV